MIASPCINICRIEGNVCVGCNRTLNDITDWYKLSDDEKQEILDRLKPST
jgi:predicted Fe-S protein YdhL (DUF1289 family)